MSQTLTQPEEIDCIWRSMAGQDREAGAPIGEGAFAKAHVFDEPEAVAAYGTAHKKSSQSDPK